MHFHVINPNAGNYQTICRVIPFQYIHWDGVGIKNLEDAGYNFFNLIETKSEFALPELLEKNEGEFDFIFIDGFHTFDHTLVDCFYASRLLRIGGILAIDDVSLPSVRRVVEYLKNYPCYAVEGSVSSKRTLSWKRVIAKKFASLLSPRTWNRIFSPRLYRKIFDDDITRMIALKKIKADNREWGWHNDFF